MRKNTLALLCNPYMGEPFKQEGDQLIGIASGQKFPIRNGIPMIYDPKSHSIKSQMKCCLYNCSAFAYDSLLSLGDKIKVNAENIVRENYIRSLDIKAGDKVLETAIGTANNIDYLPEETNLFGQDISMQMLKIAKKKTEKTGRQIELFQGDGAFVPFRDNTFDLVFQMGGLQFYENPFKGVSEMARTAKSGSEIHIVDEIGGAIRMLRKMPAHQKYSYTQDVAVKALPRLVPHSMLAIDSGLIENTNFYYLRFKKP